MHSRLQDFGWTESLDQTFASHQKDGLEAGRVVLESRQHYILQTIAGELQARISGRLLHRAEASEGLPVIGDWVAYRRSSELQAVIQVVLPRSTKLSRNAAGRRTTEQVVAANVDTVLLVMGLDGDFNLRRLERFLVTAWESGASPVIVLNKADLSDDVDGRLQAVETVAPGAPIVVTSCVLNRGFEALQNYLEPRRTLALIGSSGVGKSTLINRLLGEERLATGVVREGDDRGRHTTTHRQLVQLPDGSLLIDNPGIRELQLWNASQGMEAAFEDLESLASTCRFRDCTHHDEPGCAVRGAVDEGTLDAGRLRNFHALEKELQSLEVRQDNAARRQAGKQAQSMFRDAKKIKAKSRRW